jgi:Flp pilus assembly protein TadB
MRELKFARLPLKPYEVRAGAKFLGIIIFTAVCLIDILILFPLLDFPMEVDGLTYNRLDKNGDGINDLIQEMVVIEDIDYDEFGIELERNVVGYSGEIDHMKIFVLIIGPTLFIPYFTALFFLSYPGAVARRLRLKSLASVPQTVNYMTMSLRLSPSMETAVQFSSNNLKGPMADSLKKMLWDVYLRTYTTIEQAFIKFADEWGRWNGSFKRAMYLLRASVLEKTEEGRRQALDKANGVILSGVKLEITSFANALKGPSMFMFAFGIILPIIIATMLPIIGVGMGSLLWIILLMNVCLPLVCFIYARRILHTRPSLNLTDGWEGSGEKGSEQKDELKMQREKKNALAISTALFILLFSSGTAVFLGLIDFIEPRLGALVIILSFAVPSAYYFYSSVRGLLSSRKQLKQLEKEFPDALFQLGTRIAEGRPLERALEDTADVMKGTAASELFKSIVHRSRITRRPVHTLFLNDELAGLELTATVSATMKVVCQASEKNSAGAGEIIIDISNYLRDLRAMDDMLKQKMNEVLQTIKQTGQVFAPVIIGLTTAMYFMLNTNLSKLDMEGGFGMGGFGTAEPIPGEIFVLIFGVYLLLTVSIIVYFVTGMEASEDNILFRKRLSTGLVTAGGIFVLSSLVGFQVFGV